MKDSIYFAGLVDGEGYIYIFNSCVNKSSKYFKMGVKICMVDDSNTLAEGKKIWGGHLYDKKARSIKHRATKEWIVENTQAERFLKDILPYLRLKKQQAEIGIEFRKFVSKNNMVSENIQKYREHLFEGLKNLHHSIPFKIDKKLRNKAVYEKRYFGWHISEEHRQKLSESHKGLVTKGMFKKGHIPWTKGRKLSEEHRKKIGEANSKRMKEFWYNRKCGTNTS